MIRLVKKYIGFIGLVLFLFPAGVFAAQAFTAQQAEAVKKLTPEQQSAIEDALARSGGTLTPAATESLKNSPEFQGLTSEDIVKGKQMLEKQEAAQEETNQGETNQGEAAQEETNQGEIAQEETNQGETA
jgi:hypothetical protein